MSLSLDERFKALNKTVPVVDTHNDFPYLLRSQLHYELHKDPKFDFDSVLTCHTDLVRMRQGGLGVQFFSCWIECQGHTELYEDFNTTSAIVRDTLEQIDVVRRLVDDYSHKMKFVTTADEALQSYRDSDNEVISITLGVEGLHQCDTSLGVMRQYYDLGVRYITITHNCDNPFATSAYSISCGREDKGLSEFGVDAIKEMNRLGMIVDLSHVSHKTMVDVLKIAKAPVMFSHSSAYSLTQHERNVRDDVLQMVKANGGVVCINFYPGFIKKHGDSLDDVTIEDAAAHVKHIVDTIGWDHVGIGSDFEGIPTGPKGLEDVSKYPDLVKLVWRETNATEEDISKFMGLNVLRVWKDCERVSSKLRSSTKPVESNWDGRAWNFQEYVKGMAELYPGAKKLHRNNYTGKQCIAFPGNEK